MASGPAGLCGVVTRSDPSCGGLAGAHRLGGLANRGDDVLVAQLERCARPRHVVWPGARYAIGPPIENGFYYDFELPDGARFTDDDLSRIEARMREIMAADQPLWIAPCHRARRHRLRRLARRRHGGDRCRRAHATQADHPSELVAAVR